MELFGWVFRFLWVMRCEELVGLEELCEGCV